MVLFPQLVYWETKTIKTLDRPKSIPILVNLSMSSVDVPLFYYLLLLATNFV